MKPRHAWVATLLAGLAIGYLAGRGTTPAPGPPRSTPVREAEPLPERAPLRVAGPVREPEPAAVMPSEDVRPLPGRDPPEEGHGLLVVDFTGVDVEEPTFRVPVTLLNGCMVQYEADWLAESSGLATMELRAGTYHPSWTLPGRVGRFGRPVVIEAGRVTRLSAGDPADARELPPLDGTGRLHVRVLSAEGVPVPGLRVALEADLEAFDDENEGWTDSSGGWTFDARPGAATVRVGDQLTPVTIRLGHTSVIEIRPVDVGDLQFDLPEEIRVGFALSRIGEQRGGVRDDLHRCGRPHFWSYLAQGEYEVRWRGGGAVIGTAHVRAGEETRFAGPPGRLSVRCACGGLHAEPWGEFKLSRKREGRWESVMRAGIPLAPADHPDWPGRTVLPWLEPGLYRVEVRSLHDHPQVVEVEVGWGQQDCVLPLPQ